MCIAVPVKIVEIDENMAKIVDHQGLTGKVDISLVEAKPGDYLICQLGCAIQVISEYESQKILELWERYEGSHETEINSDLYMKENKVKHA